MAKTAKTAWGVDVGNCTLKAIKLAAAGEGVQVLDFTVIQHEKILSQPDLEPAQRAELVKAALTTLMEQHDLSGCPVVVSVPGQNSFARFIKLPPVESKRIPDIVRFEAMQQIPFDMNDVEWDWQAFTSPNSPEVEVGIFAIKRDLVGKMLQPFAAVKCPVSMVQMTPMALYNFLRFDQGRVLGTGSEEAIIVLDIGAENTELVIADSRRVWQRSIPIGGNQFTAAVQKAFKLGFAKAEGIKRTANTSKYARQIFQAMRSVFADLAAEIQRSIGFYSSSNRNAQFRKVLALGNAMKLPGLTKFLQQSLSLPIKRLDSFESAKLASGLSVAQFAENVPSLAGAYGLALQGLGLSAITSNLLPRELERQALWQGKRRWFAAASALFMLAALLNLFQGFSARGQFNSEAVQRDLEGMRTAQGQSERQAAAAAEARSRADKALAAAQEVRKYYEARTLVPLLLRGIRRCLPNEENTPEQAELYQAFARGDRDGVMAVPRKDRKQVFIYQVHVRYANDLRAGFGQLVDETMLLGTTGASGAYGGSGMGESGSGPIMTPSFPSAPTPLAGYPGEMPAAGVGAEGTAPGQPAVSEPVPGFVVVVTGTTPHHDNLSFLLMPNAELQREKWGFLNRLLYLGKSDADIMRERKGGASGPRPEEPNEPGAAGGAGTGPGGSETAGGAAPGAETGLPFEFYSPAGGNLEEYWDLGRKGFLNAGERRNPLQPDPGLFGLVKEQPVAAAGWGGIGVAPGMAGASAGMMATVQMPVYLDAFTGEPITETLVTDERGNPVFEGKAAKVEQHDYWFQVRFKVALKKAAVGAPASGGEGATGAAGTS